MCRKLMCLICFVLVLGLTGVPASADPYQQDPDPDGIVSIEAENFDLNTTDGTRIWEFNTDPTGFSGDGFMRAVPDGSGSGNPQLDYEVNFVKTGIHYVWVRGYRTSGTDDSCHAGLNGDETTSDHIQAGGTNNIWEWSINRRDNRGLAQVDVNSVGVHTFHVRMREDGWRFDKAVLTTNPDYTPTGSGPPESWRGPRLKAYNPSPADGDFYLDTWATLSWTAGDFAVSHDVYMSDNFDDVNDGLGDTFRSNQDALFYVAGFPGYAYPDGLVPGTTYYWRIDEVNEAEPNSLWKGDVWSFSVPPKTAYFPDPVEGADAIDLNVTLSWTAGFGAKLHYIVFGEDFDEVNDAAAGIPNGSTDYTPGPLKLAKTYYWRVDEFDGAETHKGDIWNFTTEGAVSGPNPADGDVGVSPTQILTWDAGAVAASHEVYFGTDADAITNATTASPEYKGPKALSEESYDPGKLLLGTTYYWRIDEVNGANPDSPWAGNVWSFTTGDYFVIDDFEIYDANDNQIWYSWHDGLGYGAPGTDPYFAGNGTGAAVGDETTASYTEETIVHGGNQSMPVAYDNNKQGYSKYSEVELTLSAVRDWTAEDVAELSLWFRGNPASVGSFIEGPVGTYTMTATGADIWNDADEFHFAFKTLTGPGTIIAKVESVGNTNAWAKAGVMIRETLEPGSKFAAVYITPTNADGTPTQGCRFQARTDTAIDATSDSSVATPEQMAIIAPYWIKLERDVSGNLRGSYSANGTTWQGLVWRPTISMSSNVFVGLALTSHDAALTCEAVFSNVMITGTVGQQWANQDIGIESNAAEPLYVAVSNSAGTPAVVVHDDPAAANIDTWTEWVIPLQAFADQGISLTNVDRIAIGLGTQGNMATPGGSGKMFYDDVRLYQLRTAAGE